jgi:creatinine amidohydrolase
MLYKHPELVRENEFVPETNEGFSRYTSNDLVGLDDTVILPSSRHTPEGDHLGHVGDPTLASEEKGEELYAELVANAVEFLEELATYRSED